MTGSKRQTILGTQITVVHSASLCLIVACSIMFGSIAIVTDALAQATTSLPSGLQDAPPLRAGQQMRRPFGALEITTFTRSPKDQDTTFRVEFLIRNESSQTITAYPSHIRLIADGIPRAPEDYSTGAISVAPESAEYAWATFRARGSPSMVFLQFGIGDEGRSYLRWTE